MPFPCSHCNAARIQGVLCHEIGCPDAWRDREVECRECGCTFKPEERHSTLCADCANPEPMECDCDCESEDDDSDPWADSAMKPETFQGDCFQVETPNGTEVYPCDVFGTAEATAKECGVDVDNVTTVSGWWARLQMPGYIDSTEWSGPYDTEAEALADLEETYGND